MALRLSGLRSLHDDSIRVGRIRRSRHPAMPIQCPSNAHPIPLIDNGQLPINLKESPIPLAEHQISVAAF